MYGHWLDGNGSHIYIKDGDMVVVSDANDTYEYSYKVVEYDDLKNFIMIERKDENNGVRVFFTLPLIMMKEKEQQWKAVSMIGFRPEGWKRGGTGKAIAEFVEQKIKEVNAGMVFEEEGEYVDKLEEPVSEE